MANPTASLSSPAASDAGERLAAYLAPQIVAEDLPGLYPLLAAKPLLTAFSALFHGSEAAVQIRLLVLREIGGRADAPRWSRREIDAHFAYLDTTKLDTIVKRLTEFDLLLWEGEDRTYRVSSQGHSALAALAALMQFAEGDEAGLGFIERRNKIIYEGALLDLAFDYEQLAPRIINGALGDLLAGKSAAGETQPSKSHEDNTPPTRPQSTDALNLRPN
jgi:hypothetical protein